MKPVLRRTIIAAVAIAAAASAGWLALASVGPQSDDRAAPAPSVAQPTDELTEADNRDAAGDGVPDEIPWRTDYEQALAEAKAADKLVVIDFFATWCGPCKAMERTTFADERVRRRMSDFIPLKIDVDQQRRVAAMYGIEGLPTTAVVATDGRPVTGAVGYLDADRFLALIGGAEKPDPNVH